MDKVNKMLYKLVRSTIAENKEFTESVCDTIAQTIKRELYSDIIEHMIKVVLENNTNINLESVLKVKVEASMKDELYNKITPEIKDNLQTKILEEINDTISKKGYKPVSITSILNFKHNTTFNGLFFDDPQLYWYVEGLVKALAISQKILRS